MIGTATPPITKVRSAALALGVCANVIAQMLYGCATPEEAAAERDKRASDRSMAANRNRYQSDPEYRKRLLEHNYAREKKARRDRRVELASTTLRLSDRTPLHGKALARRQTAIAKATMTPEQFKDYKRSLRRASDAKARREGKLWMLRKRKPRSIRSIRNEIAYLLRRVDALNKRLDKDTAIASRPWRMAGYKTRDLWWQSGDPDAVENKRIAMQARSNRRRATRHAAPGEGVVAASWYRRMKDWGYACAYCGMTRKEHRAKFGSDLEMDHVVPMPIGEDAIGNVVPACKTCNTSKSNSDAVEWATRKGITLSQQVLEIHARTQHA